MSHVFTLYTKTHVRIHMSHAYTLYTKTPLQNLKVSGRQLFEPSPYLPSWPLAI